MTLPVADRSEQALQAQPNFASAEEPFELFANWYEEAKQAEPSDPNAMTIATVAPDGMPNARMVLLKRFSEEGFVFFTHATSVKGRELASSPSAALVFHWKSVKRQIRVRGSIERVTAAEADDYFASRPRQAQIGAWASQQSAPLDSGSTLEAAVATYTAKYSEAVPRPPHWVGYRLVPSSIEFWLERPFRLHDRIEFKRPRPGEPWSKTRLYP